MSFWIFQFHTTRIARFWRANGIRALWKRALAEISGRNGSPFLRSVFHKDPVFPLMTEDKSSTLFLLRSGFVPPLQIYASPISSRRVTLILDEIPPGVHYARTGTSILTAIWIAKEMDCELRIVTRRGKVRKSLVHDLLLSNGITWTRDIEFVHADAANPRRMLPVGPGEVFLAASREALDSILSTAPVSRIIYLVQEDERCHFPASEAQLRCERALRDSRLRYLVGSEQLFAHFIAEGLETIRQNGVWFEPVFPHQVFFPEHRADSPKQHFLFYAHPENPQQLARLGLEAVEIAITTGVLDPQRWEFYFEGGDFTFLRWSPSVTTHLLPELTGPAYAALMRKMDLGLALHSGPEPSYVPLQLAASGAVAVTNGSQGAGDMAKYSENILYAKPDAESLVSAIAAGAGLAANRLLRQEQYARQQLLRDWSVSFRSLDTRLHADWKNVFDTPAAD
jgi:O-antigen biosynthesis protein